MYNEPRKHTCIPKQTKRPPQPNKNAIPACQKNQKQIITAFKKRKKKKKTFVDLKNSFTLCRNGTDHHDQEHSHQGEFNTSHNDSRSMCSNIAPEFPVTKSLVHSAILQGNVASYDPERGGARKSLVIERSTY